MRQKRWPPPSPPSPPSPLLHLLPPPPPAAPSGLHLLFLLVLLQEGRGAELLLLLGVGRLGGRALGGERLLDLLAGPHRDLHALHAGGQLADALGQLVVAVVVLAVHHARVVLWEGRGTRKEEVNIATSCCST